MTNFNLQTFIKKFIDPMPDDTPIRHEAGVPLSIADVIAPPLVDVDFDYLKIGEWYFRTLFVVGYPRFVSANWLEPLISFNHTLDISMFIYPTKSEEVLENLKRKVGEMEATIQSDMKRGRVVEPSIQVALEDALSLQQELAKGSERFFQFGLYITIPAKSLEDVNKTTSQVEATLGSLLIITKKAVLQMDEGFRTTLPMGQDRIVVTRNMDTTSLATTFPFTTSELTANEGILYGMNEHNGSLIIFDRFTLENANTVVFGKSGVGKSYMVKLEIMRSLMFDTEIIVIDPENEYEALTHALGGEYIRFHFGSTTKLNPFDLALLTRGAPKDLRAQDAEEEEESELNQKILSLHGFFRVVMGTLSATEDALLDRALILAYKQKGITPDPATQTLEPPLMEDLYKALVGMEEPMARGLADRIEKFVKGSLVGIFDQQTNVEIRNPLTAFSIRDLEEELRPIAMYLILDFIWTKVRRDMKRRILVVDEAWYMMKYPDSGQFLNSIAKRARKYYLGLTTISQDVEDFLSVDLGKAIIQNSSLQVLLKQSTAAIDQVAKVFFLSEGEKHLLLSADVGEGLFFAGPAHAAVRVIASPVEHELATTKPQELAGRRPLQSGQASSAGDQAVQPAGADGARKPPAMPTDHRTLPVSNRPIFTVETVAQPKLS
ncbi:ATP-binding protein [Patescibacteria group bacterium]|nr:ATP-binding protein [Patescibacteria group bacterium]